MQRPFPIKPYRAPTSKRCWPGTLPALTFERCDFDEADLSHLDRCDCVFLSCSAAGTSFARAQLGDTRWQSCRRGRGYFGLVDLTDSRFNTSDLNNTIWNRSLLASRACDGIKLTCVTFSDARSLGLSLRDSLLVGTALLGVGFRKQTLVGIDFSGADLADCNFRDAIFQGGSLAEVNLGQAKFEAADLRQATPGSLTVEQVASFNPATISHEQAAMLAVSIRMLIAQAISRRSCAMRRAPTGCDARRDASAARHLLGGPGTAGINTQRQPGTANQ